METKETENKVLEE